MPITCNLFRSYNDRDIILAMLTYKNNEHSFDRIINRDKLENITKYTLSKLDSNDSTQASLLKFKEIFDRVSTLLVGNRKIKEEDAKTIKAKVFATLNVELDEHQSDNSSDDNEDSVKDTTELLDTNYNNLEKHLNEIYGRDSYTIITDLKSSFSDYITSTAFFNIVTKQPVLRSNKVLNENIKTLKAKLFNDIVNFLSTINPEIKGKRMYTDAGNLIGSDYFNVLGEFYKYIKSVNNLSNQLFTIQSNRNNKAFRYKNTQEYKELVNKLLENPDFKSRFDRKFTNNFSRELAKTTLYEANNFSSYYYTILEIAEKAKITEVNGKQLSDYIFTKEENNILTALNAYSSLTHFDELLRDSFGLEIDIKSNQFGVELGDSSKYEFHKDNSHQKKSWQSSESIESEKYIAKLVDRLLDQVKIYGFKTGEYQSKSATSTSVINAARNFLDDLLFGNINLTQWTGGSIKRGNNIKLITEHALNLHDNPEYHLQQILETLFDTDLATNLSITDNMSMNQFDMDTLYSLYRTVLDSNNPNSLISQENSNKIDGPISLMSREIASLVDRNTPAYYTETSYDELTGKPVIKIKKRYFNSVQVYKQRTQINTTVNTRSGTQAKKLNKQYQFEANLGVKQTNYIAHLEGGIDLEYNSENIIKATEKGKFKNDSLFRELQNIDILSFRQKILRKDTLTDNEVRLKAIIKFIEDQLGLKILTSVGLQQLHTFQMLKPTNIQNLTKLAMKAAFVNYLYAQAGDNPLGTYLQEHDNFGIYRLYNENRKSKLFSDRFNNLRINIATYNDDTIQQWANAYSILTGQASKATTKNKEGDSIPNNSISKLGTDALYYINKQKNTNAGSLYFVQDSTKIVKIQHDLEATSQWNVDKQVKGFSQRELFFHSLINKFYGSYINNKTFLIQPTTYSDKTTFLNYEITSKLFGDQDIIDDPEYQDTIVKSYINTIGTAYKNIYRDSQNRLIQLLDFYNATNQNKYTTVRDFLWNLTEDELSQLSKAKGIDVTKDADYRIVKDSNGKQHLVINELLDYYANSLYNDEATLKSFLQEQKNLFAQQLLDTGNIFQVLDYRDKISNYTSSRLPEELKSKNPLIKVITEIFKKDDRIKFFKNWVDESTGRLIIAKANGKNYITNDTISGEVELNPLLDKFFYIEGFLSNNLRMSLTGSEINHPNKAFDTLFNTVKNLKTSKEYAELGFPEANFKEVQKIIQTVHSVSDLRTLEVNDAIKSDIAKIYHSTITTISNVAQGTQFKRNVIIPATLQYCEQNTINGISSTIKCAVIYDEKAPVFNYRGSHEKSIDSADGSAKINPFQSILENKALGTQAVGFTKKPIWHAYDSTTCSSFLAKFATNTITNESMRDSMLAHTSLYNLFKKMTNMQWKDDVNLTQNIRTGRVLGNKNDNSLLSVWFNNFILGNVSGDNTNKLLYRDKYNEIQQIHGLDYIELDGKKIYYTLEQKYIKGVSVISPTPKYHLYLDQHYTFTNLDDVKQFIAEHPEAHTINSLFELHDALGGVYCVDSKGNYSEFNNEVVVNFMNNVGFRKSDKESKILNQENYEQPLKKYHIGYALNNTAVKNGAKNINKSSAWYDDSELSYFEVPSAGLGMQMNADHDIINSELTEFSQVITATAAYGYTYDNTNEIFYGLSKASLSTTQQIRKSVSQFLNDNFSNPEQARSDLYDAIGRIIMTSSSIKDKESLQGIIMEAVNSVFYKNKDHTNDTAKIPFSDPNVYSDFIATLTSTINKEAIKRKHPGSGCVMVPAYNMEQYYEFGGNKYMFNDVLKKAQNEYRNYLINLLENQEQYNATSKKIGDLYVNLASIGQLESKVKELNIENAQILNIQDSTQFKNTLVTNYLNNLQKDPALVKPKSWFMPTDVVNIIAENGNTRTVALDSMDDYYKFKLGITDIEVAKDVTIDVNFPKNKFTISDNKGNVANLYLNNNGEWEVDNEALSAIAALIKGKVILPNDTIVTSDPLVDKFTYVENVTKPRNLRPSTIRWQDAKTNEWFNIFDSNVIRNAYLTGISNLKGVQQELNKVAGGTYTKLDGSEGIIKEGSLENQAAELIMSNIYKDKFGVESESLSEVLEQGEDYFKRKFNSTSAPATTNYDLAYIKDTGACTLLTFGNVTTNEFTQINEFNPEQLYTNAEDEIYLMQKNQQLFKVGKWIKSEAIYKDGNFYIDGKVQDKSKFRLKNVNDLTSVQERIDYVTRYKFINKKTDKNNNPIYRIDTLYKIASINDFKRALGNGKDAAQQLAKIVAKIYLADKYKLAQVGSGVTTKNRFDRVTLGIQWFLSNDFIPKDVKDLLTSQLEGINIVDNIQGKLTEEQKQELIKAKKANQKQYQINLAKFLEKEAHKRYISFLDSQNFIASRIPAQSLQSFMTMRNIAWTGNSKNMAYVSHFQTYLQGSDYKLMVL